MKKEEFVKMAKEMGCTSDACIDEMWASHPDVKQGATEIDAEEAKFFLDSLKPLFPLINQVYSAKEAASL